VITFWRQRRRQLPVPPVLDRWLFPSPLLRAQQSRGHITSHAVSRAFKIWVAQIGIIDSELLGPDGTPDPFDPALITPYALRHSYAQRHADAGVPVDVLRELMDHVAVATTIGLLLGRPQTQTAGHPLGRVTGHRRRRQPSPVHQPHRLPAGLGVGARSATAPNRPTSKPAAAPARSASSAPAAASTAPTRPTWPALEQHIAGLRADRETAEAIGAADYVIDNLTAEIGAFTGVADTMRRRLDELPPSERDEVEQASKLLRRARAARQLPVINTASLPGATG